MRVLTSTSAADPDACHPRGANRSPTSSIPTRSSCFRLLAYGKPRPESDVDLLVRDGDILARHRAGDSDWPAIDYHFGWI